MTPTDDFTRETSDLLEGRYDCMERISLTGYFPLGSTSGGLLTWWNALTAGESLDQKKLQAFAGAFSRRVRAWAEKNKVLLIDCPMNDKTKHARAEQLQPMDPAFTGVFAILVARAPALVWPAYPNPQGKLVLYRPKRPALVNHYYFHIVDRDWGHVTIRLCGHPPFPALIMLNGHEWVERRATREKVRLVKRSNCFVEGSQLSRLDAIAARLAASGAVLGLAAVCERWIYSACLCFGLTREAQMRSGFRYQFSCDQVAYSRNLVFKSGRELDEVYQPLVERTWASVDVPRLKTIFGRRGRPHLQGGRTLERRIDRTAHNLTVFKLKFGRLELKMYDKGARVLRVEMIARNVVDLRCGKQLLRVPEMLASMQRTVIGFLNVVQAVHHPVVRPRQLDERPTPAACDAQRIAGVDLQKPRMQAAASAVLALAAAPDGFPVRTLAEQTKRHARTPRLRLTDRQAGYELRKLRAKGLVERIPKTRRYRTRKPAIHALAGLLLLREKVIKPVLAGVCRPKPGRPRQCASILDAHYRTLQQQMHRLFEHLNLAA